MVIKLQAQEYVKCTHEATCCPQFVRMIDVLTHTHTHTGHNAPLIGNCSTGGLRVQGYR